MAVRRCKPRDGESDAVPRLARAFVALLLTAMVASAVFLWEPWPLTSFRLFSHLRHDEQVAWVATAVDSDGHELPYPIGSLEHGFRNFGFRMAEFETADLDRRAQLCRIWLEAADEVTGPGPREVRLYRRRWSVTDRDGDTALPGARKLVFVCVRKGVRIVG